MLLALAGVPVVTGLVATGIFSMVAPPTVLPTDGSAPIPASASAPIPAPVAVAQIETDAPLATVAGDQPVTLPGQPMLDPMPMLDPTPPPPPGEQTAGDAPPQPGPGPSPGPSMAETSDLR